MSGSRSAFESRRPLRDELRACEPDRRSCSLPASAIALGERPMSIGPRNRTARGLWLLTSGHTSARDRSRVEHELALRPECSAQVRMPPTARPAPRGERRGLLVLTAGPVLCFYGRYPT